MRLTIGGPKFVALPHQTALLQYDPDEGRGPTIEALLGWWGSAKSWGGALKLTRTIFENPRSEAYGRLMPQCAAIAPTSRVLEKTTIPIMRQMIPQQLIVKEWKRPYAKWLLANDVELSFVSGESEFEGETLFAVWVDEVHHSAFTNDTNKFMNYLFRLRDPHATTLRCIVTGRPEAGWVRETFDLDAIDGDTANRFTMLCGTDDNPTLPPELLDRALEMVPAGMEDIIKRGGWMLPPGAVFPQFDQSIHIVDNDEESQTSPIHVGLDIGIHAAAVLGHDVPAMIKGILGAPDQRKVGLLVVDDLAEAGLDVDGLCTAIKFLPSAHRIIPGKSTIYPDPTIRKDEINVIRRHFPGCQIHIKKRTHIFYNKMPGIRLIQAALRDVKQNTRVWFCRRTMATANGVIKSILEARATEKGGEIVKNDRTDHSLDALRYLAQGRMGDLGSPPPTTFKR